MSTKITFCVWFSYENCAMVSESTTQIVWKANYRNNSKKLFCNEFEDLKKLIFLPTPSIFLSCSSQFEAPTKSKWGWALLKCRLFVCFRLCQKSKHMVLKNRISVVWLYENKEHNGKRSRHSSEKTR